MSPERSIPVPARMVYRTDDPYAVHITFHIGSASPVTWTFARELLVEGVFRPCGQGDVRIWPSRTDGRSVVLMALASPDGEALLEVPSVAVSAWLERTLRVVPPGSERDRLDLEGELAELLSPGRAQRLWARGHSPACGKETPRATDETPDADEG
ncbi:regulator [Streptomyces clavuligerus]|nr:regulator [Streptomyces clavuligerus]